MSKARLTNSMWHHEVSFLTFKVTRQGQSGANLVVEVSVDGFVHPGLLVEVSATLVLRVADLVGHNLNAGKHKSALGW